MSQNERITVWQMDDCTWWIGPGPASALVSAYRYEYGEDATCEPVELSDEDLDRLKFTDTDEDERPTGEVRTFREQLAIDLAEGGKFPRLFASSEY